MSQKAQTQQRRSLRLGETESTAAPHSLLPTDGEEQVSSDAPLAIFEVPPPLLTDAEITNVLGTEFGRLKNLQQVRGIDALGWYVTFHQKSVQHGVPTLG